MIRLAPLYSAFSKAHLTIQEPTVILGQNDSNCGQNFTSFEYNDWEQLCKALDLQVDDSFLQQSVNQEVFEILLMEHFTHQSSSHGEHDAAEGPPLSKDELNGMRYAGGYVPHSLLKRFEKRKGKKYDQFIECLGDMTVESEHSDFLNYTKDWIGKVNHGGLLPLNDMTYCFFVAIEKVVRVLLPRYVVGKTIRITFPV